MGTMIVLLYYGIKLLLDQRAAKKNGAKSPKLGEVFA
jgi:hypothetical protein